MAKAQVKITIDNAKCDNPIFCHKCLLACQTQVLALMATEPGGEKFIIIPAYPNLCLVECDDCVKACSRGAITVTKPQR